MDIVFKSRLIRPAEAVLVLVGKREVRTSNYGKTHGAVGTTLVFNMTTAIDEIKPVDVVKTESPCYELHKVVVPVSKMNIEYAPSVLAEIVRAFFSGRCSTKYV